MDGVKEEVGEYLLDFRWVCLDGRRNVPVIPLYDDAMKFGLRAEYLQRLVDDLIHVDFLQLEPGALGGVEQLPEDRVDSVSFLQDTFYIFQFFLILEPCLDQLYKKGYGVERVADFMGHPR